VGPITDPNHNQNVNNANVGDQPQPKPSPQITQLNFVNVLRLINDVFVPAVLGRKPIPDDNNPVTTVTGNVVRTNEKGEAKLTFNKCQQVFLHFNGKILEPSKCKRRTKIGGSYMCFDGSLDYVNFVSNCSSRVMILDTGDALVIPRGTKLNVTSYKRLGKRISVVTLFDGKADLTYITGYKRNQQGKMVPVMKSEVVEKGQCFVVQPGAQAGEQVAGVSARTLLPNIKCAPALAVYLEVIKKTQEDRLHTLVAPEPELTPDSLVFALTPPGAISAQELIVKNLSLLSLEIKNVGVTGEGFTYDRAGSDCEAREIAEQCKIRITYTPRPNGTRRGELRFNTNTQGGQQEIALRAEATATASPTPSPSPTPPQGQPGNQPGGQTLTDPRLLGAALIAVEPSSPPPFALQKVRRPSQARKITYTNRGSAPIKITDVSVKGGNFLLQKRENCLGVTLKTGQPCTVEVLYMPKSADSHTASIVLTASIEKPPGAVGAPQIISHEIALRGQAGVPLAEPSDPELCFGRWKKVKQEGPKVVRNKQTFVLTSKRGANISVTVSDVKIQGTNKDDFSIEEDTCKGKDITDSCRITVGFSPQEAKVRKATLVITHDGKNNYPSEVQLSGVGKPRNWFLRLFDRAFADKKQTCGTKECDK
jgi:hypothetical protein